jgi:eukaryotic-like serine/threonine-protein kinase
MPPPLPAGRPSPAAPAPAPQQAQPQQQYAPQPQPYAAPQPPPQYAQQPAPPQQYAQPQQPPQQYAQQPQQPPQQQYAQQPRPPQQAPQQQQPQYAQPPQQQARPPQQQQAPQPQYAQQPQPQARPAPPQNRPPPPKPAAGAAPAAPAPIVNSSQELITGTIICSRYKVERILGRGGMGAVYAVQHVNTGEQLALKVLHPALAANAQAVERFRTEARAPVRIGTDHVVRVVDADVSPELGDVPILVMELLEGRDLGTELKRRGALPAGEVVLYFRQVARALDKAHAIGIIHRDMKPANIYLTQRDDGTPLVKILDFGIAKLADGVSGELTQDGTIFGTPWYMSPEQARGQASKVGTSIDLWALGLIAFRLLTGRNYWTAEGMAALIGQIVYDPMPPPSQLAPHLGPRFDEWFARACNREVEKRFTNASELVRALAEALGVSYAPQMTGQMDASQFPGGYSMSGMAAPGASQHGMSQSGGTPAAMSASGAPVPGGMSMSATPAPGGMSMSATPMSASGAPMPPGMQSASLSSSGGPIPHANSTASPLTATPRPAAPAGKQGNGTAIAMGLLVAVLVAGGATAAWVLVGHKKPPAVTAAVGTEASAAPTATASAAPTVAPTATAVATATVAAVEPPPTASAAADPAPSAVPAVASVAPTAAPSVAPSTAPTFAAGPLGGPKPGGTAVALTGPKPPSTGAATGTAKQPPKVAPKVDKIKF